MMKPVDRMRTRLEEDLARVTRFIVSLRSEPRPQELEGTGDNTPLSEEGDATQIVEEREIRFQLLDALISKATELEEALRRIADGTYGLCVHCDTRIHPERLQALPEAAFCLDCQKAVERSRRGRGVPAYEWSEAASLAGERGREE